METDNSYSQCYDESNIFNKSSASFLGDVEHVSNTMITDVKAIFEGKPFMVISRPNDIKRPNEKDISNITGISDCSSIIGTK